MTTGGTESATDIVVQKQLPVDLREGTGWGTVRGMRITALRERVPVEQMLTTQDQTTIALRTPDNTAIHGIAQGVPTIGRLPIVGTPCTIP